MDVFAVKNDVLHFFFDALRVARITLSVNEPRGLRMSSGASISYLLLVQLDHVTGVVGRDRAQLRGVAHLGADQSGSTSSEVVGTPRALPQVAISRTQVPFACSPPWLPKSADGAATCRAVATESRDLHLRQTFSAFDFLHSLATRYIRSIPYLVGAVASCWSVIVTRDFVHTAILFLVAVSRQSNRRPLLQSRQSAKSAAYWQSIVPRILPADCVSTIRSRLKSATITRRLPI